MRLMMLLRLSVGPFETRAGWKLQSLSNQVWIVLPSLQETQAESSQGTSPTKRWGGSPLLGRHR